MALRQGAALLQSGRLPEAEKVFRGALEKYPRNISALQLLGLVVFQQGHAEEGEKLLRKAIRYNGKVSKLHYSLGQILEAQGMLKEAASCFQKALKLDPSNEWVHVSAGVVLGRLGRIEEAMAACRRALKINPRNTSALSNLGHLLGKAGRIREAVESLEQVLGMDPKQLEALVNLGGICLQEGDLNRAGDLLQKALVLSPANPVALNNMAGVLLAEKWLDQAESMARRALELEPGLADAAFHLGRILTERRQPKEAAIAFERCVTLRPDFLEAQLGLGTQLKEQGLLEEAADRFKKIIARNPSSREGCVGLASVRIEQGRWDEAYDLCNRALQVDADYAEAHWNRSFVLLARGEFEKGWKDYEWRWKKTQKVARVLPYPMWDGSSLEGKTILVYAEQGLGDEVMFASCIPDLVRNRPALCILECDPRLESLFARSFPGVKVLGRYEDGSLDWLAELPEIHVQIPIGSLPGFFRGSIQAYPRRTLFLVPDAKRVEVWQARFNELGEGLKIGISWKGGSKDFIRTRRSIPLDQWIPLFSVERTQFINLQYGDCADELMHFREATGIHLHDWNDSDPLMEQEDFAAQIAALDLVISIDNATVHLAGALGKTVWTLLPEVTEFRWMDGRPDTPWYPTMRLFRQNCAGDWSGVIKEVEASLTTLRNQGNGD